MVVNMEKDKNGIGTTQENPSGGKYSSKTENGKPLTMESAADDTPLERSFLKRQAFVITLLLNTAFSGLYYSVNSQFRYRFFHSQYQHQLSQYNVSRGGECGTEMDLDVKAIEDSISQDAARWSLYENYVSMGSLLIVCTLLGMKSDQIGRRFIFLSALISSLIYNIIIAIVIRLELHYGWTLIGSFLFSLTGGNSGMFFAGYAVISDTHGNKKPKEDASSSPSSPQDTAENEKQPERKAEDDDDTDLDMSREKARTFKIVGLDVVRRLASSIVSFATGYIIRYAGFFYTIIMVICGKVLVLAFAYCFVTETGQQKKSVGFMAPLRIIGRAFRNPRKKTSLILCAFGLFFAIMGLCDEFEVLRTYQMSPPFCLDSVQLGWLSSEARLVGIFSMPLMWLWKRLQLLDSTIAALGLLSYTVAAFVLATFRYMWALFANPAISIPGLLTLALGKVIISRHIGRSAQASTFAVLLAAEEMFWFAGSVASNYMYQHFVSTVPTAPFYMATASFAVGAALYVTETWRHRRSLETQPADLELNVKKPCDEKEAK